MMGRLIGVMSTTLFAAACSQPVPPAENGVAAIVASVVEYHDDTNEARCAVVASGDAVLPEEFQPRWLTPSAPRSPAAEQQQRQLASRFTAAKSKPARLADASEVGGLSARTCNANDSVLNVGKIWIDTDFAFVDSALICGPECGSGRISALQWDGRNWIVVGVANSWIS